MIEISDENTKPITQTTSSKYYGVLFWYKEEKRQGKGFITREEYCHGKFLVACLDSLTNGNALNIDGYNTLETTIAAIFDKGYKVFEFDTPQELMKWLSEP